MTTLDAAAWAYAIAGLHVFPLRPREKLPATAHGFQDASTSEEKVRKWWGRGAACNIGIATGSLSGFWVLDLDGPAADEDLAALEARHGALPITAEQRTGKGRQLLFAWSSRHRPVRNLSKRSRERIGRDIDVRGDGGYIVAPPSIHPNGRTYAWASGRSPQEVGFAPAPEWLMELVVPPPAPERPAEPPKPRPQIEGNATRYGEKALDNACREIATAQAGTKNDTLWLKAIGIGALYAGGEIVSRSYALDALREAGRQMCQWTDREESTLLRGFTLGEAQPKSAPERRERTQAGPAARSRRPAAEVARHATAAARLWSEAGWAWNGEAAYRWLVDRGLDPFALPEALNAYLRTHSEAPWGDGRCGPAILAPLVKEWDPAPAAVEGVAVLPLGPDCERFTHFVGESARRVLLVDDPPNPEGWLVALDLQDAWALATAAREEGWRLTALVAPRLSSFAGGALGDRYGRVDPDMPLADPAQPPFTAPLGELPVQLAVRGDLRSPPLRLRKALGGTTEVRLQGDAAARFYGGLAEQHWKAAGANRVRVLRPSGGAAGFNQGGVA